MFGFLKRGKGKRREGAVRNTRSAGGGEMSAGLRRGLISAGVFLGMLVVGWGVVSSFHAAYFLRNDRFVLRHLDIHGGPTLKADVMRDYLRELLGLREGASLFAVDLVRARDELMREQPSIREMTLVRRLPDRMEIRIIEREPLARIGNRATGLVVDVDGFVFHRYVGVETLPVIVGLDGVTVQAGVRLTDMAQAAVCFVAALERQSFRLPVTMIDASREDYLLLSLADQKQVKLAWEGMEKSSYGSAELLRKRLVELSRAVNSEAGRNRRMWDATVPGRVYAL
jgi:cell division septal protein FtsQ